MKKQIETFLASRDSKNKIRIKHYELYVNEDVTAKVIKRSSGLYNGKQVEHAPKTITKGKAGRTVEEQADLEYSSLIKKDMDKGYIILTEPIDKYTDTKLDKMIPGETVDTKGVVKPMLAKPATQLSEAFWKKSHKFLLSRKIDGTRCLMYWDGKEVLTSSRGGKDYDYSTMPIRQHPKLIEFFKKNPDIILDGELYKHGKSLQQISGAARLEKTAGGMDWLEYYVYDLIDPQLTLSALDRAVKLEDILFTPYNITFNPNRHFEDDELRLQAVPYVIVKKQKEIKTLHDEYVEEGFEGAVARESSEPYKPKGRDNRMIKFKQYFDECFKVIGIEEGLRGYEDMVFILEMPDGRTFKAKPLGDKLQKEEYYTNFEKKYKNQIGECKYFSYSDTGIPTQPVFKAFRDDI